MARRRLASADGVGVAAAILVAVVAPATARGDLLGQEEPGQPTRAEPFIGVVEVPAALGASESEPGVGRRPVALRAEPTPEAPVARLLTGDAQLEYVEHRYEEWAAPVHERRDGWYRVGYLDGERRSAWLAPEDAGRFTSLDSLLRDRLHHMTETWDRRLYRRPGMDSDYRVVSAPEADRLTAAELVKLSEVGEDRWAMLVILGEGERCTMAHGLETVVAAGWVPLFGADGKPNLWFYARGC